MCLEEGTLAGWLYEVLEPHVEELVVTGVRESRGPKSDKVDAFALAEQLRIGSLETRVYKGRGKFRRLGHMARAYGFVVRDVVRVKNRLKSVLRSRGPLVRRRRAWNRHGAGSKRSPGVAMVERAAGLHSYDRLESAARRHPGSSDTV